MNILILHRYFWPQPYPYAQMLKYIAENLAKEHSVSILTTDSGNDIEAKLRLEWSKSTNIDIKTIGLETEKTASLFKKAFNSLYFGFRITTRLLTSKTDIVMVATTPPVIIASLVRWISYFKNYKYVYHCQDIHPEAMLLGGYIKKKIWYKVLLHLDKKNINSAWKVITLSKDMKKTIIRRECKTSHINIINNFIFEDNKQDFSNNKRNTINFLFAGSLGRLQNLNALMHGISLLKHRDDIHFSILGDGIMLKEMVNFKETNNLKNIKFFGQVSLQEAIKEMHSADFGLISIGSNICEVAYPSKTMMYLGNGLPVLALVDENTDIYNFINDNNLGMAISPTSHEIIAKSIELLADNCKQKSIDKNHVKKTADQFFGKETILNQHLKLYS